MNIGTVTVTMNNWIVESDHSILLGISGENAVARLDIITTVDDGWIYMLEIEHLDRGEKNIIPLTAETNKVYAVLTSEMLGNRGGKNLQIRAINGEQVKKSNVFRGYVNNSVNASENIPEHEKTLIDRVIEEAEEALLAARQAQQSVSTIPQTINAALEQAKESGEFKGDKGDTGEQGPQGPKGDLSDDEIALKEDIDELQNESVIYKNLYNEDSWYDWGGDDHLSVTISDNVIHLDNTNGTNIKYFRVPKKNTSYIVSFFAKVDTEVYFESWLSVGYDGNNSYHTIKSLTGEYQNFTLEIPVPNRNIIIWWLPGQPRAVYIKDLIVYEKEAYIPNEIKNINTEIKNINTEIENINTEIENIDNGIDTKEQITDPVSIADMTFKLQAIKSEYDFCLYTMKDNLSTKYGIQDVFEEIEVGSSSDDYSLTYDNGLTITTLNTLDSEDKIIFKTMQTAGVPNKFFEIEIDPNKTTCNPLIGIWKDNDNYIFFKINPTGTFSAISCVTGELNTLTWIGDDVPTALYSMIRGTDPYKLRIASGKMWKSPIYLMSCEQNGVSYSCRRAGFDEDMYITSVELDYKEYENWYFCFGAQAENHTDAGGTTKYLNVSCGYSSGFSVGSDYKLVRYITGEPITNGNCVYVCATSHSNYGYGYGGSNIYKLDLSNYELSFVSKLYSYTDAGAWGSESPTILYDKRNKKYIVSFSEFGISNLRKWSDANSCRISIGETKEELLSGVHFINTQLINADFNNSMAWDLDFIVRNNKFIGSLKGGKIVESETYNASSEWSNKISLSEGFEGNVVTRVGNTDIVTQTVKGTDVDKLSAYNLQTGEKICDIKFDRYPKGNNASYKYYTPVWGSIFPVYNNGITSYYAVMFSMRSWEAKQFGYGDMWIYKGDKVNIGDEFASV